MASPLTCSVEEDEDDLFEIDLNAFEKVPSPKYYWDSGVTATGSALLANCLLPISDLSSAIPTVSRPRFVGPGSVMVIGEPIMPLGEKLIVRFSSLCDTKA